HHDRIRLRDIRTIILRAHEERQSRAEQRRNPAEFHLSISTRTTRDQQWSRDDRQRRVWNGRQASRIPATLHASRRCRFRPVSGLASGEFSEGRHLPVHPAGGIRRPFNSLTVAWAAPEWSFCWNASPASRFTPSRLSPRRDT